MCLSVVLFCLQNTKEWQIQIENPTKQKKCVLIFYILQNSVPFHSQLFTILLLCNSFHSYLQYAPLPIGPVPPPTKKYAYGEIEMDFTATFYDVLDQLCPYGPIKTTYPITMEEMQQVKQGIKRVTKLKSRSFQILVHLGHWIILACNHINQLWWQGT